MRKQDKYINYERANLMLEQNYLKSKGLLKENYSLQNFINDFNQSDFFKGFLRAVATNENGLDLNNDWYNIIKMSNKEVQGNFGLDNDTATKVWTALQPKIKDHDFNTVDGRVTRLKDFFKEAGTGGDIAEFKAIYNHFKNGGKIEDLETKLKNTYLRVYKPFTEEQFIEIFNKVNLK
jgi:hypothetical protein